MCLQGAPEMIVKMRKDVKPVIVIEQNGKDFKLTIKTPIATKSNSFTIGKESEMTAVDGRKFKVIQASNSWDLIVMCELMMKCLCSGIYVSKHFSLFCKEHGVDDAEISLCVCEMWLTWFVDLINLFVREPTAPFCVVCFWAVHRQRGGWEADFWDCKVHLSQRDPRGGNGRGQSLWFFWKLL